MQTELDTSCKIDSLDTASFVNMEIEAIGITTEKFATLPSHSNEIKSIDPFRPIEDYA